MQLRHVSLPLQVPSPHTPTEQALTDCALSLQLTVSATHELELRQNLQSAKLLPSDVTHAEQVVRVAQQLQAS
jgi:hypothetical protein